MPLKKLGILIVMTLLAGQASAQYNVNTHRTIIRSNTLQAMPGTEVSGSLYNNTAGNIRQYYDATDATAGYAGQENFWNQNWGTYLGYGSALGPFGPLGYTGPLSATGPLFNSTYSWSWNNWLPAANSSWAGFYVWNGSATFGSSSPYGATGPLGYTGPITQTALYTTMYHLNETGSATNQEYSTDYNDFPHHLDPAGVWGILGPGGPFGVLGPLGPLGTRGYGASGAVTINSATGEMKSGTTVVRSLDVPFHPSLTLIRNFDLSEVYPRANLIARQSNPTQFINDTSFSVNAISGSCTLSYHSGSDHTYYFKSKHPQFVSLVLSNVNAYAELDFDVSTKDDSANSFASSGDAAAWFGNPAIKFAVSSNAGLNASNLASGLQDFAVFRVKANEVIKVVVKARSGTPTIYDKCGYLFHVTGTGHTLRDGNNPPTSSSLFQPTRNSPGGYITFNITGSHQEWQPW